MSDQFQAGRRRLLTTGTLLLGASAVGVGQPGKSAGSLSRIAFGSCANQEKDQPIWEALGERQWAWLEQQFEVPADLRIVASSLQVLADFPGWEGWINYARDHQRLIEVIRRKKAHGVVFISGDTHYAELSRLDVNVPYTFWDLTSSGLTEVWPVDVPNANRVGTHLREPNFGLIEIDWWGSPSLTLQARNQAGQPAISQRVALDSLRPA